MVRLLKQALNDWTDLRAKDSKGPRKYYIYYFGLLQKIV